MLFETLRHISFSVDSDFLDLESHYTEYTFTFPFQFFFMTKIMDFSLLLKLSLHTFTQQAD